jgi:hypothetical protein
MKMAKNTRKPQQNAMLALAQKMASVNKKSTFANKALEAAQSKRVQKMEGARGEKAESRYGK